MKKITNSILFLTVVAVAFASCTKNELEAPGASEDFVYTFSLANDGTKALIGGDSIEYETGDALGVFVGSTANASASVDVNSTPVTVSVKASQALASGDKVYAYCPYSAANASASASAVTLSIPQQQTQTGPSFDADAMPMVAHPYTVAGAVQAGSATPVGNLYMNNLGAIVEFGVYGADFTSEKIQSVTFTAESAIAGTFKYDLTGVSQQTLSITGLQLQSVKTSLSTTLSVAADRQNAAKVYMVIAPGEYKGHIEVKTDAARYTYALDEAVAFNRSRVRPVTLNLVNATRAAEDLLTEIMNAGYDPDDYVQMDVEFTDFAYYNSSNEAISRMFNVPQDGWGTTICDFVCTPIYDKDDLPNGTLIVSLSDFKYRPEGWTALDVRNGSNGTSGYARPDEVTDNVVEIDRSWWSAWNYRAFNLAYQDRRNLADLQDATETLCPQVRSGFGIFLPKTPKQEDLDAKSIKILAIGNSFSVDAMEYLYGILKDAGYSSITLGNLYIGGCTLETHAGHFTADAAEYKYYVNTTGTWSSTSSCKPLTALKSQDWDYITMQQGSPKSGLPDTFDPYLSTLVSIVKEHKPNAQLAWHMTWAYQANSTHSGFASYSNNQMTMYNAIVNATQTKILTNSNFVKVIPNGTAVQNLRTSYLGDNLTRDGYHMSYDNGRYVTALTFAKALTGCDLADVTYTPSGYTYSDKAIAAMKDAADKAIAKPYEVTTSAYPPDASFDYATATLEEILSHDGYDPSSYSKLELTFTNYAYWNSTSEKLGGVYSEKYSAANESIHGYTNYKEFICTQIIPKSSIPAGSVIVVKGGCKYRPDGWVSLDAKASSRPAEVTSNYTVLVNDVWWGTLNYRGFNVAFNPRVVLTDTTCGQLQQSFAIYVPKK